MRSLAPVLLPVAATALAVTTVSTVVAPSSASPEPARPVVAAASPGSRVVATAAPRTRVVAAGVPGTRVAAPAAPPSLPTLIGSHLPPQSLSTPRGRWAWPLHPRPAVARPFIRPASTWGAGHRGVDLTTAVGSAVGAVDDGQVGHVGMVAGRGTVTVLHGSGLRSTYEPVNAVVTVGDLVRKRQLIGSVAAGGHCAPAACLHVGALRGSTYIDPLTLLGASRVRLLPLR